MLKKRKSKFRFQKEDDLDKRYRSKLVKSAADLWFQCRLSPPEEYRYIKFRKLTSRWFVDSLTIFLFLKFSLGLRLGWDAQSYQKYSGDFFVGFGSAPVWFFMNAATFVCGRYFSTGNGNWFLVFDIISGRTPLVALRMPEASLKKFLSMSKMVFGLGEQAIDSLHYILAAIYGLLYLLKFWSLDGAVLTLFWTLTFLLSFRGLSGRFLGLPLYFYVFCLYVNRRMAGLSTRINAFGLDSIQKVFKDRLPILIENTILKQERIIDQIRSCNRLYRHVTAVFVPTMAFCLLCLVLGVQRAEDNTGKALLAYLLVLGVMMDSFYFLSAAMVTRAVKRCHKAWACALARLCHSMESERNGRLPMRTQLKVLASLEYLASKKHRVGFSCLHWFALTDFTLLKTTMFLSTSYFYVASFASQMEKTPEFILINRC